MTTWSAMTWNILMGGEERFDAILALIARERPDVLVLQECLGWTADDQLARVAGAIGIRNNAMHTVLGVARPRPSGNRYHVAVLSRFPIIATRTYADPDRVGHVIVEADIAGPLPLRVFGTHFDAHGEDQRLRDAVMLTEALRRPAPPHVLVAGDLNALSRLDPYPRDLDARLSAAGTMKFGIPARYDTMDMLGGEGLVDLLWVDGTPAHWVTAVRDYGDVRMHYRTDYLLASPRLAEDLVSIRVVDVGYASDHAAVIATFRTGVIQ